MNREIKFRAWDREDKVMIGWEELKDSIDFGKLLSNEFNEYDNFAVMQYTGIKDGEGDKIYEGDILLDEHGEWKDVVGFKKGGFVFGIEDYSEPLSNNHWCMRIIGNIHANPELLK